MFVGRSKPTSGDIKSLTNIDYFKRYIIIEMPEDNNPICQITISNISSTTGRSQIGIIDQAERIQSNNIYHCVGAPFTIKPPVLDQNVSRYINPDSYIKVNDVSYGAHIYDLRKRRFSELTAQTSYSDTYMDDTYVRLVPNCLFFNKEHQTLNEDITGEAYGEFNIRRDGYSAGTTGDQYSNSKYIVRLGDLITENTFILVNRKSNFDIFNPNKLDVSSLEKEGLDLNTLSMLIVGPVTDLLLGLIFNEIDFCYDSIEGLSRIRYKTDHKLPNEIYWKQLQGNALTNFEQDMETISLVAPWAFRVFVFCRLGNVSMKVIGYDTIGGRYDKQFDYSLGKFRNDQHITTVNWFESSYGIAQSR